MNQTMWLRGNDGIFQYGTYQCPVLIQNFVPPVEEFEFTYGFGGTSSDPSADESCAIII